MTTPLEVLAIQARQLQRSADQLRDLLDRVPEGAVTLRDSSVAYLHSASLLLGTVGSYLESAAKWQADAEKARDAKPAPQPHGAA